MDQTLPKNTPHVVSAQDWDAAWQRLLVKEKEHTRARDALAAPAGESSHFSWRARDERERGAEWKKVSDRGLVLQGQRQESK